MNDAIRILSLFRFGSVWSMTIMVLRSGSVSLLTRSTIFEVTGKWILHVISAVYFFANTYAIWCDATCHRRRNAVHPYYARLMVRPTYLTCFITLIKVCDPPRNCSVYVQHTFPDDRVLFTCLYECVTDVFAVTFLIEFSHAFKSDIYIKYRKSQVGSRYCLFSGRTSGIVGNG